MILSKAHNDDFREAVDATDTLPLASRRKNYIPWILTLCNAGLAIITFYLSPTNYGTCLERATDKRYRNLTMNADLKATSTYSPMLDEIDLSPKMRKLDGTFKNNSSIFRQDPSPEVDKAWDFYSGAIFTTTSYTLAENGKRPGEAVKAPVSWNRGDDAYIIQLDVFHEIHCLNWLRKDLNWEYYYGEKKPTQWWLDHRAHCIHVLLQTLMCHADLDIVPYNWVRKSEEHEAVPDPDFNVVKNCRNFDALLEWAENNEVKDAQQKRKQLRAPKDAVIHDWPYA